ncbi:MAG: hypothetical protein AAFN51_04025 [Pseudomonadota bacterium]
MALTDTLQSQERTSFWSIFWSFGRGLRLASAAEGRMKRIEALTAKTDEELAAMGLRRVDIPAFVFRDILYD